MSTYEIIKKLCSEHGIALTALEKELGFGRGSLGKLKNGGTSAKRLQQVADYFGVSINYLISGENNSSTAEAQLNQRDERDIAKRLENTLNALEDSQESLMFSGESLDDETRELLKASLENSLKIAKINAKQKFTPKKYRTDNE